MARRLLHSCDLNHAVAFWDCLANAHRLTEIEHKHDNEQPRHTGSQKGRRQKSGDTQTCTQLSCKRQGSPTSKYYRSGERARITMRPQTKYARSQGTTSPQISVTLGHFSYQPIIWHRGPRPRAHWYMCTDVANPRIVTLSQWTVATSQPTMFTTMQWKPKEPPCFFGRSTEDVHTWTSLVRHYLTFMGDSDAQ